MRDILSSSWQIQGSEACEEKRIQLYRLSITSHEHTSQSCPAPKATLTGFQLPSNTEHNSRLDVGPHRVASEDARAQFSVGISFQKGPTVVLKRSLVLRTRYCIPKLVQTIVLDCVPNSIFFYQACYGNRTRPLDTRYFVLRHFVPQYVLC